MQRAQSRPFAGDSRGARERGGDEAEAQQRGRGGAGADRGPRPGGGGGGDDSPSPRAAPDFYLLKCCTAARFVQNTSLTESAILVALYRMQ